MSTLAFLQRARQLGYMEQPQQEDTQRQRRRSNKENLPSNAASPRSAPPPPSTPPKQARPNRTGFLRPSPDAAAIAGRSPRASRDDCPAAPPAVEAPAPNLFEEDVSLQDALDVARRRNNIRRNSARKMERREQAKVRAQKHEPLAQAQSHAEGRDQTTPSRKTPVAAGTARTPKTPFAARASTPSGTPTRTVACSPETPKGEATLQQRYGLGYGNGDLLCGSVRWLSGNAAANPRPMLF